LLPEGSTPAVEWLDPVDFGAGAQATTKTITPVRAPYPDGLVVPVMQGESQLLN